MGDTFAILALRRKRAHLAGEIDAAQRDIMRQRDVLTTLDAVIRLVEPASSPELIAAIRPVSRRSLYFRHGEQPRICVSALREAGQPVTTRQVAEYVMEAKGPELEPVVRVAFVEHVRSCLARLAGKGVVTKIVEWPEVWWELATD
jgi:hypothetical protein